MRLGDISCAKVNPQVISSWLNYPVFSLASLNCHVSTVIQRLFAAAATAARVHLCRAATKPVISTNATVRGAALLFTTQERSLAGALVIGVPLLLPPPPPADASLSAAACLQRRGGR